MKEFERQVLESRKAGLAFMDKYLKKVIFGHLYSCIISITSSGEYC